ncbi:nuclear transport factor 2 family protein [Massilia sp. UYP11]|uniref:nuclear transport factor 2 family protein n=1 Tax=Massilia sp. UYP11 TaxID=1756385 RepID=UPI003D1E0D51
MERVPQAGVPKSALAGAAGARPAAGDAAAANLAALRAAEQQRAQAVANRDVATLRKLISGDYYHVETGGRSRTKTEFLQLLSRDEFELRSYEVDDMEIRTFDNGRAALVTGRFRAETQDAGRLRGRYVRMWVLGPDGWRNTVQQNTEIRLPATQRDARCEVQR